MKKDKSATNVDNPNKKENDLSYDSIFSYLDQIDASGFITIPEESQSHNQNTESCMDFIAKLIGTIQGMFF